MFENNEYVSYSFEPVEPEHHAAPQAPQEPQKPQKRKHRGVRVVALALCCALLGGLGGGALTAYLFQAYMPETTAAQAPAAPENSAESAESAAQSGKDNVVVSNVVHTNTGDKDMTPQEVYNMYVNSVVGITTSGTTTNVFGQETPFAASGSGFIISEDGYIVSNQHVVSGADTVKVSLYDGTSYDAKVVGSEASNDVALLKVDATGLTPVAIGSSDAVAVGDRVAAIGNPLGQLTFSLTVGYVSALDRTINTDGKPINMLQTDVAINAGNSGGPLFDMNGNVIGITTAKYSGQTSSGSSIEGISFAIPIDDVMAIVEDLRTYGYVTGQAYLGVTLKELDARTAAYYGLPAGPLVDSVTEDSCAEKAGVQQGDIIIGLGDASVESYSELVAALRQHKAGETVTLTVYRAGQELELEAVLDEKLPEEEQAEEDTTEQQQPQQGGGFGSMNPFSFFFGY